MNFYNVNLTITGTIAIWAHTPEDAEEGARSQFQSMHPDQIIAEAVLPPVLEGKMKLTKLHVNVQVGKP